MKKTKGVDSKTTTEVYVKRNNGDYLWLFNFKSGGFNDSWGSTLEDAIADAKRQFPSSANDINEKSFRQATEKSAREQDRLGYMMTC